jgi:hypothetical protein
MSTPRGTAPLALRYADIGLLALALPIFILADLPLVGYAAAAVAWIAQRIVQELAARRVARELAAGQRRTAMGFTAGATLGRVWFVAAVVLAVGLIGDRADGLAAAVLSAVLFTLYFAIEAFSHLLAGEGDR